MDDKQRLDLSKLIKEYQTEETTDKIRELKHSKYIRRDVGTLLELKEKYSRMEKTNNSTFRTMCENKCNFLYNNYTNLFNKLYKDELDIKILSQFVTVLSRIEEGELDQHDASYIIGNILKKLYIDSALRHEKHMEPNDKHKNKKQNHRSLNHNIKNISWNQYKKINE